MHRISKIYLFDKNSKFLYTVKNKKVKLSLFKNKQKVL